MPRVICCNVFLGFVGLPIIFFLQIQISYLWGKLFAIPKGKFFLAFYKRIWDIFYVLECKGWILCSFGGVNLYIYIYMHRYICIYSVTWYATERGKGKINSPTLCVWTNKSQDWPLKGRYEWKSNYSHSMICNESRSEWRPKAASTPWPIISWTEKGM